MHAVTGIDDGNVQAASQHMRRSGRRVANDNAVRAERLQGLASVNQRLAFFNTGRGGADH